MLIRIRISGAVLLLLLITMFSWVYTVQAETDVSGPAVSGISPAPGSITSTVNPKFQMRFDDPAQLDPAVVLKIDGQAVAPVIQWDGIYESQWDTCYSEWIEVWVADDHTKGVITAQLPNLTAGQHTMYYNVKDRLGNVSQGNYTFGFADAEAPQITQQNPANGAIVNSPKPIVTAKVTDYNGIASFSMSFNGIPVNATYDPFSALLTYTVPQPLKNGAYPVQVTAADSSGNTTTSSWSFIVNETNPPTITNLDPPNGKLVGTATPVIEASISDPSGIANPVYLEIDGNNINVQYNAQTGKVSYLPGTPLPEGQHAVNLAVYDIQGNKAATSWSFSTQAGGPIVSDISPAPGSVTTDKQPGFSLRFNDPHELDPNVIIKLDGQAVTSAIRWDGIYQSEWDSCNSEWFEVRVGDDYTNGVVVAVLPQLSGGQHTVYYSLKDRYGNTTESSYNFNCSDIEGPQISQQTPANGTIATSSKPSISAKITDNGGILASGIKMTFNGVLVNASYDPVSSVITYAVPQPLKNGTYPVQVTATDNFGNITTSSWSFVVMDTTPPSITNLTPANGSQASGTTVIEAGISDTSGIINPVYFVVDSVNYDVQYNGQTGKASFIPSASLAGGQHTVTMAVYDLQGNKATASWAFSVDSGGPTISQLSPAPGSVTSTISPQFSLRFNDSNELDPNVIVKIDGQAVTPAITWDGRYEPQWDSCSSELIDVWVGDDYTNGVVTVQLPRLTTGQHTVYYNLKDKLGNKTEGSYSFTFADTQGPQISQQTPAGGTTVTSGKPTITAKLTDSSNITAGSVTLSVNGTPVSFSYDPLSNIVTYQPQQFLPQGANTVELKASDSVGNNSVYSWSFTIIDSTAPQFSLFSPAPGSKLTINPRPTVSVKIADTTGINAQKVSFTLNGASVGAYNPSTGVISYTPTNPLFPGQYTVLVLAYDVYDNQASYTWTFTVPDDGFAQISNMLPPPGSGTRTTRPTISADINDSANIDVSRSQITLDGVPLTVSFAPSIPGSLISGKISALPASELSNAMHNVTVTVYDSTGGRQVKSWMFGVNTFGEMPVNYSNCTDCHNQGPAYIEQRHASVANCTRCHGGDCGECHSGHDSSWPPPIGNTPCLQCHTSDFSAVHINYLQQHNDQGFAQDCIGCHSSSLTQTHNIYVEGTGIAINCQTCHQSTDAKVVQAINSATKTCTACHGTAGSGHDQFHQGNLTADCLGCHQANISTEHLANSKTQKQQLTCNTCHGSSSQLVKDAIAAKNLSCTACHGATLDHEAVHLSGIDDSCSNCHAGSLTTDHITGRPEKSLSCNTCHTSAVPKVARAVATGNEQCAACHSQGHGLYLIESQPIDIPLYTGFNWSSPMDAKLWLDEPWMPREFIADGKLLVSDRRSDITGNAVWEFYQSELIQQGWQLSSTVPDAQSNYFSGSFIKGDRKVVVSFYGGEAHNPSPVIPGGYRIEILYR